MPSPAAVLDRDLVVVACNRAYEVVTHRGRKEMIGRPLFDIFPAREDDALETSLRRVLEGAKPDHLSDVGYVLTTPAGNRPGRERWSISNIPMLSPAGEVTGILHCPLDVTTLAGREDLGYIQSVLDVERRRLQQLFKQAPGFICVLKGPRHVYEFANDAYYQLVGHREIIGHVVEEVLPEVVPQGFLDKLDRVYRTGEPFVGRAIPIKLQRVAGGPLEVRHIDLVYQPVVNADHEITGIFVQGNDVSEAHQLARRIAYQAAHDPLTGLINRREFQRVAEDAKGPGPHALLYMDIDHFKIVNDRCGHVAGDRLLEEVAAVTGAVCGKRAALARLGGDEFAAMVRDCDAQTAVAMAHELRRAIRAIGFVWKGMRHGVTLSVGVATFGQGANFATALGLADAACFLAKEAGRDRVKLTLPSDEDVRRQTFDMDSVTRLKEAIREDRIVLFGQRIEALNGSGFHVEIVSRMRIGSRLVPPAEFIPAAERFGMIEALDRHVLARAFAQLSRLDACEGGGTCFFINLSGVTLGSAAFPDFVERMLAAYPRIDPSRICFEVTETAAISCLRRTAAAMETLSARGFRFALDDFGSGMASFAYLQQLPVQFVKIDGAFVKAVHDNAASAIIVESVARLARCMNIATIAESIESRELLQSLRPLGIDFGQGYALHRPEPLEAAVGRLRGAGMRTEIGARGI